MKITIREWLADLPKNVRSIAVSNALANYKKHDLEFNETLIDLKHVYSMQEALRLGFVWSDSPEGYDFWNKIYNDYDPKFKI